MIVCSHCQCVDRTVKAGKTKSGSQLYLCRACGKRRTHKPKRPGPKGRFISQPGQAAERDVRRAMRLIRAHRDQLIESVTWQPEAVTWSPVCQAHYRIEIRDIITNFLIDEHGCPDHVAGEAARRYLHVDGPVNSLNNVSAWHAHHRGICWPPKEWHVGASTYGRRPLHELYGPVSRARAEAAQLVSAQLEERRRAEERKILEEEMLAAPGKVIESGITRLIDGRRLQWQMVERPWITVDGWKTTRVDKEHKLLPSNGA